MSKHTANLRSIAWDENTGLYTGQPAVVLAAADHLERTERALRAERKRSKIAREMFTFLLETASYHDVDLPDYCREALEEMKAVK